MKIGAASLAVLMAGAIRINPRKSPPCKGLTNSDAEWVLGRRVSETASTELLPSGSPKEFTVVMGLWRVRNPHKGFSARDGESHLIPTLPSPSFADFFQED